MKRRTGRKKSKAKEETPYDDKVDSVLKNLSETSQMLRNTAERYSNAAIGTTSTASQASSLLFGPRKRHSTIGESSTSESYSSESY